MVGKLSLVVPSQFYLRGLCTSNLYKFHLRLILKFSFYKKTVLVIFTEKLGLKLPPEVGDFLVDFFPQVISFLLFSSQEEIY